MPNSTNNGQRIFDPRDMREFHLAASICDNERVIAAYLDQRDHDDCPEFRRFRNMALYNRGICV